jgi:hypothetical protein
LLLKTPTTTFRGNRSPQQELTDMFFKSIAMGLETAMGLEAQKTFHADSDMPPAHCHHPSTAFATSTQAAPLFFA